MKYRVKVRWREHTSSDGRWLAEGPSFVFDWKTWKWVWSEPGIISRAPFEWPEFWAGVIDVLLADKADAAGRGLPPSAVIDWERNDAFVRIAVRRVPFPESGDTPPAWFSA